MKCIEIKENLSALHDGELDSVERENTEIHLSQCVSCQARFERMNDIGNSNRQILPVSTSETLDKSILNSSQETFEAHHLIAKEQTKRKIGWFGVPKFAYVVGLVCIALAALSGFQMGTLNAHVTSVSLPRAETYLAVPEDRPAVKEALKSNIKQTPTAKTPVVKLIKVPIVKSRVVTKIIYRDRKGPTPDTENDILKKALATESGNFQMVRELIPRIIRKGESDE